MCNDRGCTPLSLSQHFEPPEGYYGYFGWLCGFSADAGFLNAAVERFTGLTAQRRAYSGKISLALVLDPGHPQISPIDAPGVIHLGYSGPKPLPFALLHAKVALLGFCHASRADGWRLRLIVSTGNWTTQTLEQSLDLAWRVELDSDELSSPDEAQTRADIACAWGMFRWLFDHYDSRILRAPALAGRVSETQRVVSDCRKWLEAAAETGPDDTVRPRFMDNRELSFLAQLPSSIKQSCSTVARNCLVMASGFFQTDSAQDTLPSVLKDIVTKLQGESLLTNNPAVDVVINQEACQGVAGAAQAILTAGWVLREPGRHACFGNVRRFLHAKFIFSANRRANSFACNSAWLYLGSGNLTNPGFSKAMSNRGGNLEAGVLFSPEGLLWTRGGNEVTGTMVTDVLPLQWEEKISILDTPLEAGEDMSPHNGLFAAPPVSWLRWCQVEGSGLLEGPQDEQGVYEVLTLDGKVCESNAQNRHRWPETNSPRQVRVRWPAEGLFLEASVPVLDDYGRVAATELPPLDLEQAWWHLDEFPAPPPDDDPGPDVPDPDPISPGHRAATATAPESEYPVRRMMRLIESMADKQIKLAENDWAAWCARFEQVLSQAAGSAELLYFQSLGLNPLSPLWHPAFRPPFAETGGDAGRLYEEALHRVECIWATAELEAMGDLP